MKKFPILLLIIFLISSCSNDDSVIFEFEKEIVKSKHCLMVYDLNYNETYDCTNSIDTSYTINANVIVNGKKITNFFTLYSQKDFEDFQKQYEIAINSKKDFSYQSPNFYSSILGWELYKYERKGQYFISLANIGLLDFQIEIEQKDWQSLISPNWKIKYFSDIDSTDLSSNRKEISKEEFLRLKL